MKNRLTIILITVLFIVAIVTFAFTFNNLSNTKADLANTKSLLSNTQAQLSNSQTQLSSTKTDLANAKSQLSDTQAQLINFQNNLQITQTKLTSVQEQLSALQTSISKPAPIVADFSSVMQGTGFLGLGAQEMIVTVTVLNKGGPGKVTITAKLSGTQASQSGSTSLFLDQSEQQVVTVVIPGALTNETLSVTAQ